MGIGVSVFLIAVGAILAWGVNAAVSGANLDTIGYILMAVGGLGLLIALFFLDTWRRPRTDRVIERERMYPPAA